MKRFFAALISFSIALVLCEFLVNSYFKVPAFAPNIFDIKIGWKPRPNATGWNLESNEKVTKGPLGWHDRIFKETNPVCTLNFFGDSFLEGAQFALQNNFSSILESQLKTDNSCKSVYVNNFGLSGTGTLQQARLLQEKGVIYPAQHSALFVFLGNDIQNNLFSSNNSRAPGFIGFPNEHTVVEPTYRNTYTKEKIRDILAQISDFSSTFRLIAITLMRTNRVTIDASLDKFTSSNFRGIGIDPERYEWEMEALRISLKQAAENAQQVKTELSVFLLPTAEELAFGDTIEVKKIKNELFVWCGDFRIYCYDTYEELKQRNGKFQGSKFHLSLNGHLNKEGHLEVAKILSNFYFPKIG